MVQVPLFSIESVDGYNLGRLCVPLSDIADWINFLTTPHYRATIVSAEQSSDYVNLYFQGNDGLYLYLDQRLNAVMFRIAS